MPNDVHSQNDLLSGRLAAANFIATDLLARAKAIAIQEAERLDRVLIRLGMIEESELIPIVCAVFELDMLADPVVAELDENATSHLSKQYLHAKLIVPVHLTEGGLGLVMADPANSMLREEVAFHLDRPFKVLGATTATVRSLLARLDLADEVLEQQREVRTLKDTETLRRTDADGPVIKFVQEKFADAVAHGASDIHFESTEDGYDLRFRVNGVLVAQRVDPTLNAASVIARLKVMAEVNVAERRLPQDGRMEAMIAGRKIDFRFSSLPTQWGESIVCRVLDPKALRLGWDRLGFPEEITARVKRILEWPSGLFLVTGPTGSGKTTTLYTALSHLNTVGVALPLKAR